MTKDIYFDILNLLEQDKGSMPNGKSSSQNRRDGGFNACACEYGQEEFEGSSVERAYGQKSSEPVNCIGSSPDVIRYQ